MERMNGMKELLCGFFCLTTVLFSLAGTALANEIGESEYKSHSDSSPKVLEEYSTDELLKMLSYNYGSHRREKDWLEDLIHDAKKGDISSQVLLGKIYQGEPCFDSKGEPISCLVAMTSRGVRQDYREAIKWFRLAAEQDNSEAQYELAIMYLFGIGVRQNYFEATNLLKLAAIKNYGSAQVQLGAMYEEGLGVQRDLHVAKEWYGRACDNNYQSGCNSYKELNRK